MILRRILTISAQRVEHYEIAGYTTARNLALQSRQSAIAQSPRTSSERSKTPVNCWINK